jgi:hypothetical protein
MKAFEEYVDLISGGMPPVLGTPKPGDWDFNVVMALRALAAERAAERERQQTKAELVAQNTARAPMDVADLVNTVATLWTRPKPEPDDWLVNEGARKALPLYSISHWGMHA